MDLLAEKLRLIEWLVKTQDVQIVRRIAEFMNQEEAAEHREPLVPMTVEELQNRIDAAEEDVAAGRVYDISEVRQELLG